MKTLTKVVITLIMIVLMLFASVALADGSWVCPSCGETNDRNFCGCCGTKKPSGGGSYYTGDTVTFGHYPQTASGTDNTPIEWIVLDVDTAKNKALLLSRYCLDYMAFNANVTEEKLMAGTEEDGIYTWEKSTLRAWLNGAFMERAFTDAERALIKSTTLENASDTEGVYFASGWEKHPDTVDKVFVLSYLEADRYFDLNDELCYAQGIIAWPTAYAVSKGAYQLTQKNVDFLSEYGHGDIYYPDNPPIGACGWWLRSFSWGWVYNVSATGMIDINECSDVFYKDGVRPAMWVSASAVA